MSRLKSHSILLLLLPALFEVSVAQEAMQGGNGQPEKLPSRPNRIEVRGGPDGMAFEYRRDIYSLFGGGLWVSTNPVLGAGVALTATPFPVFLIEGLIGLPTYREQMTDAAPFTPDYMYGVRAGVDITPAPRLAPIHISITVTSAWMVENSRGGGGYPPAGFDPAAKPTARREVRQGSSVEFGLGMEF